MSPKSKKILKRIGIVLGIIILLIAAAGIYIYSLIPKPFGDIPALQSELFSKPAQTYPVNDSFIYKSATELSDMIRNHKTSSVDIVTSYINYIKNNNYKYNAMVWLFEDDALRDAKRCDSLLQKGVVLGALHGVPMTVKEAYFVKGKYCTLNAKEIGGFAANGDQKIIQQLRNAGAVILGSTNVPYMLMDYQTYGDIYPPASNPYDTSLTPGGSTGGGAAALAAGFTPLEVGTDMGGSIRVPSSFCGLYGLKTTEKALDIWDAMYPGYKFDMDYAALAVGGPMARNPTDLELLWNVLRKTPNQFMQTVPYEWDTAKAINQYHIAWMDNWQYSDGELKACSDIREKLEALVDTLHALGAVTDNKATGSYTENNQVFFDLLFGLQANSQPWIIRQFMGSNFKGLEDGVINHDEAFQLLKTMDPKLHESILAKRKTMIDNWNNFLTSYDFFICPVTLTTAFKKCERGTPLLVDGKEIFYWNNGAYALSFNALGNPSIVIPLGLNKNGVPVGVQVVGKYFSEPKLIHFAKQLEPYTAGFIKPGSK
ncbi:MAG TPA: amidase [Chitinophagaceae bacterium]|nr:amidase [Chitinophagaceae bacterium]